MLREYKKDNSGILISGTKQILINRVLSILNQGCDVSKPDKFSLRYYRISNDFNIYKTVFTRL